MLGNLCIRELTLLKMWFPVDAADNGFSQSSGMASWTTSSTMMSGRNASCSDSLRSAEKGLAPTRAEVARTPQRREEELSNIFIAADHDERLAGGVTSGRERKG